MNWLETLIQAIIYQVRGRHTKKNNPPGKITEAGYSD